LPDVTRSRMKENLTILVTDNREGEQTADVY
jgi:hypothetical protein